MCIIKRLEKNRSYHVSGIISVIIPVCVRQYLAECVNSVIVRPIKI